MRDLGKLIVAKGFKKLSKVQKIAHCHWQRPTKGEEQQKMHRNNLRHTYWKIFDAESSKKDLIVYILNTFCIMRIRRHNIVILAWILMD